MANALQRLQAYGQSVWYDNISRQLFNSGELTKLIKNGVTGITSNPTIFEKSISSSTDYDQDLAELSLRGISPQSAFEVLAVKDIQDAADLLLPVYESSQYFDGYVSIEVSPYLAYDTNATITEGRSLFKAVGRPNVMIKVPATPEGIPAIRQLISDGINVNVTLIFAIEMYEKVIASYIAGIKSLLKRGGDPSRVASVASFFVSRVDTAIDGMLRNKIQSGSTGLEGLLGKAAIANARTAYKLFQNEFNSNEFKKLQAMGARVQRPLWASTSTKDPNYPDTLYVDALIGPDSVNTMPPATIDSFLDHGDPLPSLEGSASVAEKDLRSLSEAGIDMALVTNRLMTDGVKLFANSYTSVLDSVWAKMCALNGLNDNFKSLGAHYECCQPILHALQNNRITKRVWDMDYTLWSESSQEISNRLGWLNIVDRIRPLVPEIQQFTNTVLNQGFTTAVLIGMGGSSLGAEVMSQVLGSNNGHLNILMLDSTSPGSITHIRNLIDIERTLFIISSKSGGTTEVHALYRYFRGIVEDKIGVNHAGAQFIAITDKDSELEVVAQKDGFRHTFLNPEDVGGRFSVLSLFGIVPAALAGIDVLRLLERADRMRETCGAEIPLRENPGAKLGAIIGSLESVGINKLMFVSSPSLASYGLWVEQLIAESLCKNGKGIIPVATEPIVDPQHYSNDRLFVYLRMRMDDNRVTDSHVLSMQQQGHPVLYLEMNDGYDLGSEFFRWEFAIAVAGHILDVHPFNQPNVQEAKEFTEQLLNFFVSEGALPETAQTSTPAELLNNAQKGDYVAIQAYLTESEDLDEALQEFRRTLLKRYRLPIALGYGPRYLHSTGQLHKGGPGNGIFLQLTQSHQMELPIPDHAYSFKELVESQALGDLQALQSRGRRIARFDLGNDPLSGIRELVELLG